MRAFQVHLVLTGEARSLSDIEDEKAINAAWDVLEGDGVVVHRGESTVREPLRETTHERIREEQPDGDRESAPDS
jgi:hypothetical protein